MERALVGGAVTEEADTNLIGSADLGGKACADGDVMTCTDDAVGTEDALRSVSNVHGAALALAVTGVAAKELRHHQTQIAVLGDDGRGHGVYL